KHCTGEFFNWLNSDDYLEKGSLYKIAKEFLRTNCDVVAGKVRYFDEEGHEEILPNQFMTAEGLMCWSENVKFIQPGVWLNLDKLKQINGVDEDPGMRFAFDWDMQIRYLYHFPHVSYIPDLLVHYRLHSVSNTVSDPERYGREEAYIIEKLNRNPEYAGLHNACQYKTKRRNWFQFLNEV